MEPDSRRPFVGRPLPRFEDLRLVRGAGRFTDDVVLPDQTYATFVRTPHAHARIVRIETDAARRASGVLDVLTGADYLADGCQGIPHIAQPTDAIRPGDPAFRYRAGRKPLDEPQLPLASERVRFVGEAVAVVIAETAAAARDGAGLVVVDYVELPAVVDLMQAIASAAPSISEAATDNVALDGEHGDRAATQAALAEADVMIEYRFHSQRIANAQMEPRAAIGVYEQDGATYLSIAGCQGVNRLQMALAAALHVSPDRVRVVCPDVGGGFGPRSFLYAEQVVVTWAARRIGRPVRWASDRSEAFLTDHQGRDALATVRLGLGRDGRIRALAADCLFNIGAHTIGGYVPIVNFSRILTSVYDVPHAYVRMRGVLTNTVATGPFRGAGRPEAMFMMERLLDLGADRLAMDRIEIRARNLIPHEKLPYRSPLGLAYDSGDFARNMSRALELADWRGFPIRRAAAAAARGRYAGIGLANYIEAPVGAPHERVKATIRAGSNGEQDTVELIAGTQSTGQGHETSFAQVVADQLGVTPDRVRLISGDTSVVRSGGGTHSDRSMRLAGTLIVEACQQIRERSRQLAAHVLEVSADDLVEEAGGGAWAAAGAGRRVSLFDLARAVERDRSLPDELRAPLGGEAAFTGRIPAHPTGTAVCELEVDPETGAIQLTRYTAVDDVGQPINPLILHGQVAGGIAQGLGQALTEQVVHDAANGQLLTGSFLDYAIPGAELMPTLSLELAEDPTAGNPLRVKGGGESGITPSLAAVVNAAVDALSPLAIRHLEMPVTSARIWAAIRDADQEANPLYTAGVRGTSSVDHAARAGASVADHSTSSASNLSAGSGFANT